MHRASFYLYYKYLTPQAKPKAFGFYFPAGRGGFQRGFDRFRKVKNTSHKMIRKGSNRNLWTKHYFHAKIFPYSFW